MATLDVADAARFRRVEKDWLSYRDAWCPAHAGAHWGTLSGIVSATCLLDETIKHTINVEQYPRDSVIIPCA